MRATFGDSSSRAQLSDRIDLRTGNVFKLIVVLAMLLILLAYGIGYSPAAEGPQPGSVDAAAAIVASSITIHEP